MPATSRTGFAAAIVALVLAGTSASAAVSKPKGLPTRVAAASVIPVRVGTSVAYRYDFDETGPRGTTAIHAVVALTRVASDRVTVTLSPDAGEPTAVVGRVVSDGTLHLDAPAAGGRGAAASAADLPQDGPLGGLPDDPRGAGTRQPGAGAGQPGAGERGMPAGLPALASLLALRASGNAGEPTWTFSAPVGPAVSGAVPLLALTARATTAANGTVETIVADGHGDVQLAATGAAGSPAAVGGRGAGATRRRSGGQGGYPGGGQGGYPGGGQGGNPGGGQGGYPGGGGQGGYPGGGQGGGQGGGYPSRRGGQDGSQSQGAGNGNGGTAAGRTVPATVVLHVESVFRDGRLHSARGTQTSTVHGSGGTDVTTTSRWTLSAY